jgi:hypothetical protein
VRSNFDPTGVVSGHFREIPPPISVSGCHNRFPILGSDGFKFNEQRHLDREARHKGIIAVLFRGSQQNLDRFYAHFCEFMV